MRRAAAVLGVLVVIGLAGCGERDQSLASSKRKADTPAWQSDTSSFAAPGYAPGDRGAWEQQLRNRAQAQNDFAVPK